MKSSSDIATQRQEKLPIREEERRVLDKPIVYRLYQSVENHSLFEIEIASPDERERASLGRDHERATDIYRAVVSGEVTPCTLKDIIDDCFH